MGREQMGVSERHGRLLQGMIGRGIERIQRLLINATEPVKRPRRPRRRILHLDTPWRQHPGAMQGIDGCLSLLTVGLAFIEKAYVTGDTLGGCPVGIQ